VEARMEQLTGHLKLLGDKSRLMILACLRERELCVCDLVELVGLSQPGVSQHLRKLKEAGFVKESRRGTWIYYSLSLEDKSHVESILSCIPPQTERLNRLKGCGE